MDTRKMRDMLLSAARYFIPPPSLAKMRCNSFLAAFALFIAHSAYALPTYNPISTDISIPSGYTQMLVPAYQGRIMATAEYGPWRYPSTYHNMQFMAFRNPTTKQIFYVQTTDPDGQVIDWEVVNISGSYSLKLTIYSLSPNFPSGFYLTDNAMTADSDTNFYRVVAKKYRSWAINQKWVKRKISPVDTMATMAIAPDLRQVTLNNDISPYITPWNGQKTGCWITFWRKYWEYGLDGAMPDYRLGGTPSESLSTLSTLSTQNCAPIAYTNALLWDSNIAYTPDPKTKTEIDMNEIWVNNPSARYDINNMIKDQSGNVLTYDSNKPNRKYICQASQTWKNTFLQACRNMAADGWKGIYYDMAAFSEPKLCYAPDHGHDIADPRAWQNGIRGILSSLKTDNATKDMMVITEGNAEIYMDLVDAYLTYAETAVPDNQYSKQVPLFREVYGDIARFIGWQLFSPSNPSKTFSDVTPAIMNDAVKKSANFGSLFYASPYFIGWGAQKEVQTRFATDTSYSSLFDAVNNPQYKKVFERGGGASNWKTSGTSPVVVNAVDPETGGATIKTSMANRDNGDYYELNIDEASFSDMSWDMKMAGSYYILVTVAASDGNLYNLLYDQHARSYRLRVDRTLKVGLGADTTNGKWQTVRRNIADDLLQATSLNLTRIMKFRVYGAGYVDNIALSNTPKVIENGGGVVNWTPSNGGLIARQVTDSDTSSNAISFSSITNRDGGGYFRRNISDSQRFEISWDMKTSMPYYILITVAADNGTWYNLLYDGNDRNFRQTVGTTLKVGLGNETSDGQWRTFRRNLADDLFEGAGVNVTQVIEMRVYATATIDNVLLWGNGIRTSGR